jgi:predicted HAD superfamily Cof-like phosphohydrolase
MRTWGTEEVGNCEYSLTDHLDAVREFMVKAKQTTSFVQRIPSAEERILRAKLIYEEAMETIEALGVDHILGQFVDAGEENCDLEKILDGAADLAVVTNGTLIACGLDGVFPEALELVDINNLSKVNGKHSFRKDGKLLKPSDYIPVNLNDLICYMKDSDGNRY